MEPVTRFPILELPTELVLLILRYAAEPAFSQAERYDMENPYSSAVALCRVSRLFRRTVLPEMLRTVLLSAPHRVAAFMHALRMQKAYAQQNHHLHFEYAPHVHRIWIIENRLMPHLQSRVHNSVTLRAPSEMDFSLLAPVLLAAESLAIDSGSLSLLSGCLAHAWNIDHARSPPPWNTKSLTLSVHAIPFHLSRPEGSAFLASISHLIVLANSNLHVAGSDGEMNYMLPAWMPHARWAPFKNLQTVSVALPHIKLEHQVNFPHSVISGMDLQVELLTFSASLMKNHVVRVTIVGYLAASYYKEVVLDSTYQLIHNGERLSWCRHIEFLPFNYHSQPAPTQHDSVEPDVSLTGENLAAISTPSTSSSSTGASPITSYSAPYTLSSQTERLKRLSLDYDTTLVTPDHNDFVKDVSDDPLDTNDREGCSSESALCEDDSSGNLIPGMKALSLDDSDGSSPELRPLVPIDELQRTLQILFTIPRLKPPDTTQKRTANGTLPHPPTALRHQKARLGKQKYDRTFRLIAARDSIAHHHIKQDTAIIDDLEQLYNEILIDKAALVDGWVAAMAELGLTSILSPQPSLLNPKTTIAVTSTSILPQD
ncbi:hypothetical protein DFH29DRAFT_1078355 [Suillus ampliporus]|nr:hypothetical protein DFH29DRAFT_1078355 [Suillus ampliporus]